MQQQMQNQMQQQMQQQLQNLATFQLQLPRPVAPNILSPPETPSPSFSPVMAMQEAKPVDNVEEESCLDESVCDIEFDTIEEKRDFLKYTERIQLLKETLDLESDKAEQDDPIAVSADPVPVKTKFTLPPSEGYMKHFNGTMLDYKGENPKRPKDRMLELRQFPTSQFRPKLRYYAIKDCPWGTDSLIDPDFKDESSILYKSKDNPPLKISHSRLRQWEASNRNALSVANYTDHFLLGIKNRCIQARDRLEAKMKEGTSAVLDYEGIQETWNDTMDMLEFVKSTSLGISDMVKGNIDRITSQVVSRRDAYLEQFPSTLPMSQKKKLRVESVNNKHLFSEQGLGEAKDQLKVVKQDKLQDRFLEADWKVQHGSSRNASNEQGNRSKQSSNQNFRRKFNQNDRRPEENKGKNSQQSFDKNRSNQTQQKKDYSDNFQGRRDNKGGFRGRRRFDPK